VPVLGKSSGDLEGLTPQRARPRGQERAAAPDENAPADSRPA